MSKPRLSLPLVVWATFSGAGLAASESNAQSAGSAASPLLSTQPSLKPHILPLAASGATTAIIGQSRNIRDFGVLPANPPAQNKRNLQNAIDWASLRGASLWVEPSDEPYRIDGGIILKANVSLVGAHGPVGRGTKHPTKAQPVGSVFNIEDEKQAFLTVESATQVRGIQFWYPRQTLSDPAKIIAYPPTIQVSSLNPAQGVTGLPPIKWTLS